MAGEIVVERDRNGEALTATTLFHCVHKTRSRDDAIVPLQVEYLALEERGLVRWHELLRRITGPVLHTVVHESDPRLSRCEPKRQHRCHPDWATERPRYCSRDTLPERDMRIDAGHGSKSEPEVLAQVERVDSLDALRDEWRDLAPSVGGIFATWEWADTWWRHFGRGRTLLLHACRDKHGRLAAVVPLYAWRERWPRVIRFLGHGPGDQLGPVCVPRNAPLAATGIRRALERLDWDVVLAEQLPGEERWTELLGGRRWRREASPVLSIPEGGWEGFLATRSANLRQQLRSRERRLARTGRVQFRLADASTLERDLDNLFALHCARWRGQRTDFADTPFHRELAHAALDHGWLRLWLLELDGRPVAAWHGFHVDGVASYYQAGRDPAYAGLSVGFVLLAHTIRNAIDEGACTYGFGRGAEEFKYRFTDEDPGLETLAWARGRLGHGMLVGGRAARAARRRLVGRPHRCSMRRSS